jgi:ketosteroid isomerase-like protein
LNDLQSAIDKILEKYKAAVHAKDADAFTRLYDPKVRVFDTWGVWSYEGLPLWQVAVEAWFASLGNERVKVSFEDVQSSGSLEFAVVSAVATYAAFSDQGEPLRSMQNRLSWGLRTSGHVLRIIHEHTSVPVGFEDAKAILHRPAAA